MATNPPLAAAPVSGWRAYCGNVRLAAVFFVHVLFGGRVSFHIPFRSTDELVVAYARRTPFEMRMTIREEGK